MRAIGKLQCEFVFAGRQNDFGFSLPFAKVLVLVIKWNGDIFVNVGGID